MFCRTELHLSITAGAGVLDPKKTDRNSCLFSIIKYGDRGNSFTHHGSSTAYIQSLRSIFRLRASTLIPYATPAPLPQPSAHLLQT
jgi:hypothetical protein